jgi:SAM-dependent methyltransferase
MSSRMEGRGRMSSERSLPKLYGELAEWWPILSAPEDYAEEAAFYKTAIIDACDSKPTTLLELGSGGGNNASHLKRDFLMTLVDLSPGMLAVSRRLNPECEHVHGDMRTVRLGRQFDAVFIHDAVTYMTSQNDLSKVMRTAYEHCKAGGAVLFAPDHTRETFKPSTKHGGHDGDGRSLRYLEWSWDPDPNDSTYVSSMVYVLREGVDNVRSVLDMHEAGLFSQDEWLRLLREVGFEPKMIPFEHSELEAGSSHVFVGVKGESVEKSEARE